MEVKDRIKVALRKYNEEKEKTPLMNQRVDTEEDLFQKYYHEWKGDKNKRDPSYNHIPKFHFRLPPSDNILQQKLREDGRALFLQRRGMNLLGNTELRCLWSVLEKHKCDTNGTDESVIDFDNYVKAVEEAGPKCKRYLTAKVFAKLLQNDPEGRVSVLSLFNYVMRKVWIQQTHIGLSLYDLTGQGYLRESDLENYILELIPTLPQLNGLEKSFQSFYVCTAARKFSFFLDCFHTGKVKIQDILACTYLDDLLELRDEERKDGHDTNWFSAPSALHVYGQYLSLDKDRNGMLSKDELECYGTGTLTNVFLDRVFQECLTYDGEMDYKTYLDFVLALEHRNEPQALQYFFKILDVNSQGYLDVFSLNYFFRAIIEQLKIQGHEVVVFEDVNDEIFDMVRPIDPCKITLKDMIQCGQGGTVVSILIDLNGFWTYENREMLQVDPNEDTIVTV